MTALSDTFRQYDNVSWRHAGSFLTTIHTPSLERSRLIHTASQASGQEHVSNWRHPTPHHQWICFKELFDSERTSAAKRICEIDKILLHEHKTRKDSPCFSETALVHSTSCFWNHHEAACKDEFIISADDRFINFGREPRLPSITFPLSYSHHPRAHLQ